MKRLVARWWLVGAALFLAVLVLACALYLAESSRRAQQDRAAQRQALSIVQGDVNAVLVRELSLARVIAALGRPTPAQWPALANIVTSEPAATSAGFIVPVREHDRTAFQRSTGLRLVESPVPGRLQPADPRPLHLVLVDSWSKQSTNPNLGIDLSDNPLRRDLMLEAARTDQQLATPPVAFLGRSVGRHGVIVYAPVFGRRGVLEGWVTASYEDEQLAATMASQLHGARVLVRDGRIDVIAGGASAAGAPTSISVAGRRWAAWASVPQPGISLVPWLVLGFGLALATAVSMVLRQTSTRERYAARRLAEHDAEEAALGRIATLVAQGTAPGAVFAAVAEEVGTLLRTRDAAVIRFDYERRHGVVVGAWSATGAPLTGAVLALNSRTASAEVFRTKEPVRIDVAHQSGLDKPGTSLGSRVVTGAVAAPIVVAGRLWGTVGASQETQPVSPGAEQRIERFSRLVGLAISNAHAWERLDREASTDALTGIANRRVFDERLRAELARAGRHDRDLSLALFDLDHFKQVNDVHGHPAGDRVLAAFAQLLAAHARQDDLVARVGGEEFAWLMPETDRDGALAAAERLRLAVEEQQPGNLGVITTSAGVVSIEAPSTPEALLLEADRALYEAKASGRNATVIRSAAAASRGRGSS